ncbi:uncharacterized protein [Watersipora subatra]|uniref:uncharacterized protein n=1 Tax=Watersipora subatra TaxID=2589382 RepID=UPI00355B39E6
MESAGVSPEEVVVDSKSSDMEAEPSELGTSQPAESANSSTDANPSVEIRGDKIKYRSDTEPGTQQGSQPVPYQNTFEYWRDRQKPVKEKNLKVYKILGIFAIIAFFPLGIFAFYHALKLKEDFYLGLEKGDLVDCNKRAMIVQKLLMLSFTASLFTTILILAVVGGIGSEGSTYSAGSVHL